MSGTVKDDLFPAMTWPQRQAAWNQREGHLLLDNKALQEQLADELQLRLDAQAEARKYKLELARAYQRICELESAHRVDDAKADRSAASKQPPSFVKANVAKRPKQKPGRKTGHAAALRPAPAKIDQTIDVPLAKDQGGRELCPRCRGVLLKLLRHRRVVEDLTPSNVEVTAFNTRSGHCINCDCRVESRAAHQSR